MATKNIMLFGANGQVGQVFRAEPLPADWQLHAYGHADLDITQYHRVQSAMREIQPDLIINSAAMTNVDEAEKDPHKAMAINFSSVANIAAHASVMDVPVIHLSTDYVFDGRDNNTPYTTEDRMNPLNAYGESKMMGEEALRQHHPWHVILRISSVFSAYGKNLLTNMMNAIDTQDEVKGVTDIRSSPTYAPEVAKALIKIGTEIIKGKPNGFGVYHLSGSPEATRFELTQAIMEAYAPHTTRRPKIVPAKMTDFPSRAERPTYSVLDCTKIKTVYGIEQKPWREGLTEAISMLMRERKKQHDT